MRKPLHVPRRAWREGGRRYKRSRRAVTFWVLQEERRKLQALADKLGISLAGYARAVIVDVVEDSIVPACLEQSVLPRTLNYETHFKDRRRPVGTWVSTGDWERLHNLARTNNVSLAVLLRAAFNDVLEEEFKDG